MAKEETAFEMAFGRVRSRIDKPLHQG